MINRVRTPCFLFSDVPKEECTNVPKQKCEMVPIVTPRKVCTNQPREVCKVSTRIDKNKK